MVSVLYLNFRNGKCDSPYISERKPQKNISHKTLSSTLKEMEADGLIIRKEYPQIPPKVEYSLSERGESLVPILVAMCEWGGKHKNNV